MTLPLIGLSVEEPVLQDSFWRHSPLPCRLPVVHITPTRTRELNNHQPHSPKRMKGIHTWQGAARWP